jgi:hypothetical protein
MGKKSGFIGLVSEWTADTALGVLFKDLIAAYNQGVKHNVSLPFNALSSTQLFDHTISLIGKCSVLNRMLSFFV